MLPPGCIILDSKPFFFYDYRKATDKLSMNDVHYHNFFEIYLLLSGKCEYLINDKVYSISPNSLIMIPNGVVHKTVYTSPYHERIVLSFSESLFHESLSEELQEAKFCHLNEKDPILHLFNKISVITDYKNIRNQILLTSYLNELLIYMIDHHKDISKSNINIPSPINYVINHISENFQNNISLKDLAGNFGYSTDHFSKLFKESTGSTFKEYLLLTRFTTAEKLLLTTNKSITEIAFCCGFNDSNYFTSLFKKRYGISPLKYKKIKNNI